MKNYQLILGYVNVAGNHAENFGKLANCIPQLVDVDPVLLSIVGGREFTVGNGYEKFSI
jgi:hypothetical protein